MDYLYILREALVWLITIFWLYQIMVSLCSLVKIKDKPLKVNKNHKFMAIIPAHNEEAVVGNLIESLKKQNYDKYLYDIYVIADNCTDNTAKIAKEAGAIVYERFDETKKTKGYALDWFLNQKIQENADYDAFFVFDADNIVHPDFIKNMNKKLCQGEEVVQGYRDIKNPSDNWITAGYALFYWTMHRFYHLARYNLGLSPLLNGTGFMVKFDVIKPEGGLKTVTLTGWTVGHMQCIKEYTGALAEAAKEKKTMMNFDGLLYIVGSIPMFVLTLVLLCTNFVMYAGHGMTELELIENILRYLIPTFLLPIGTSLIAMILDRRPIKPMLKGLLCYPLFMGTWLVINFKCLFKRTTTWEKIDHVRNIKIGDVGEEEVQVEKI